MAASTLVQHACAHCMGRCTQELPPEQRERPQPRAAAARAQLLRVLNARSHTDSLRLRHSCRRDAEALQRRTSSLARARVLRPAADLCGWIVSIRAQRQRIANRALHLPSAQRADASTRCPRVDIDTSTRCSSLHTAAACEFGLSRRASRRQPGVGLGRPTHAQRCASLMNVGSVASAAHAETRRSRSR